MDTENKPPPLQARRMKVYYGDYSDSNRLFLPMIRLHGRYLLSFGFTVGSPIEVVMSAGQITIRKIPDQESSG